MYCALSINVHYIEYLARMGELSELLDTLDDNVNVHWIDSTSGVGYRSVGVISTVVSSVGVLFTGLFFFICCFIHSYISRLTF